MTVSTNQGSPACRNTYPATGGSSKIAISGRMFSHAKPALKRKGNYGMRRNWSTGHCKRGGKPFEVVYIDFVSMPLSKGKRYILTILDSFSRHLMAIPCARDRAIDAARGLYQFFLRHREIPRIVSSDRGTHFTGEVYKEFCDLTSITREFHCPWRPQSSGNIERQYRTLKNALYMICEDRNCEWTDVLESAVSSMNATANTATGASPHYIITGRQPNIGLPKIPCQDIVNNNPGAYGMQINALLRQVHQRVALANNEADHKMEAKLNRSIFKDPIQVGDKVLLHRPQSATAHLSHLPWIEVTLGSPIRTVWWSKWKTKTVKRIGFTADTSVDSYRDQITCSTCIDHPHLQLYPHLTKFPITRRHDHSYLLVHPGNLPITRCHDSLHFRQGSILSQMTAVPETIPKTQRNEQHAGNSQHALKTSLCAKKQNK